jgi:hypothetical protein
MLCAEVSEIQTAPAGSMLTGPELELFDRMVNAPIVFELSGVVLVLGTESACGGGSPFPLVPRKSLKTLMTMGGTRLFAPGKLGSSRSTSRLRVVK